MSTVTIAHLGVEVADPVAFETFLAEVVGLVSTAPGVWTNDDRDRRLTVTEGPANDATVLGLEVDDEPELAGVVDRLTALGHEVRREEVAEPVAGPTATAVVEAPWGVTVEIGCGEATNAPRSFPLVPGGFLTGELGFGHVVFATPDFDESVRFVVDGLGMAQSDWLSMEVAPGLDLEVRFFHGNGRHHSIALARAPFELPQRLHHLMVECNDLDDVGAAFDRVWQTDLDIANGLGRHDNDAMFSFYVVTPAGFQVEIGHGARTVGPDWNDDRRYDRISRWGHQRIVRP